ncbi:hypothetical protein F4824DRAFT_509496 [Ustulina deusta]|nr:hypothetical protein F4824DRAFT_509496 [Ustulina deusta]
MPAPQEPQQQAPMEMSSTSVPGIVTQQPAAEPQPDMSLRGGEEAGYNVQAQPLIPAIPLSRLPQIRPSSPPRLLASAISGSSPAPHNDDQQPPSPTPPQREVAVKPRVRFVLPPSHHSPSASSSNSRDDGNSSGGSRDRSSGPRNGGEHRRFPFDTTWMQGILGESSSLAGRNSAGKGKRKVRVNKKNKGKGKDVDNSAGLLDDEDLGVEPFRHFGRLQSIPEESAEE